MRHSIFWIIGLALVVSLAACKKDNDEEAPVIGEVRINNAIAGDHNQVDAGSNMTLTVTVSDNDALAQLKIDIHPNEDGHSHTDDDEGHSGGAQGNWEELVIAELSGTSESVTRTFNLPETIAGEWHLSLRVIDEKGNESAERIIELDVENDNLPEIDLQTLNGVALGGEVDVQEGDNLEFVGTVNDSNGLEHIHIHVMGDNGVELYEMEYEVLGEASFDLSTANFVMPAFQGAMHADVHLEVENTMGLISEVEFHLHLE